jgi:hypothetical protein
MKGKAPAPGAISRVEEAAAHIGEPTQLRYWRNHPL